MESFYIFIIGIAIGFILCVLAINNHHKEVAKRGYISIENKLYKVKEYAEINK